MHAHRTLMLWIVLIAATAVPLAATGGEPWFSDDLFAPRLGQPALELAGESFASYIGIGGSYGVGEVTGNLTALDGATLPLTTVSVTAQSIVAGNDLDVMLFADGLTTLQEIVFEVPVGTPAGFYGIEIDVAGSAYESQSAVRVYDAYPASWGFIHITDTHVGYDGSGDSSLERLEYFVREANFLDPELVVITGDVCEHMNEGHDWPQQYLGAVAELRVPLYVVPGNHDYYNDGESYDAGSPLRYFHEINRFENSVLTLGPARLYGVTTQYDHGLFQLWRCHGPSDEALDWIGNDLAGLASSHSPRLLLMHGPNFDSLVWNTTNVADVRDLMATGDFDLALAGHTHRFETYLNSGSNSLGRNDFSSGDDWERDVLFPGYPLHVQTPSLGKDQGESMAAAGIPGGISLDRGPLGETIAWRWVQVDGLDVSFFTADTDGDGYRDTETPWMLGEITFSVEADTAGVVTSSVANNHYETWSDVRHYVPADPGVDYDIDGGTLVDRLPDGTATVAVASVGPTSVSTVVLTPEDTGVESDPPVLRLGRNTPNPFSGTTTIRFELPCEGDVAIRVFDVSGRVVDVLTNGDFGPGRHEIAWDGLCADGHEAAGGIYFFSARSGDFEVRRKMVLLR